MKLWPMPRSDPCRCTTMQPPPRPFVKHAERWVPDWYHIGMSKQIAVRLPDELVAFVDGIVGAGDAPSRAAVVSLALERERRRKVAERDAAILSKAGTDTDLDALAEHAVSTPMDDLD